MPGAPSVAPDSTPAASSVSEAIAEAGVPMRYAFLPTLDRHAPGSGSGEVVAPTYTTSPAPMGLADLGLTNVSGTLTPTRLTTSRVAGTFAPSSLAGFSVDSGAPDAYGVQVNAVLTNVTLFGNSSYEFWTQNVVEYSTFSHQLAFLDNVWNFSGSTTALSSNAILAHGPNGTQVGTTFYYALGPVVTIGYPFTLSLFLNAVAGSVGDEVFFNYTLSNASATESGSYDYVEFNATGGSADPTLAPAVYLAQGASYNPVGIPDDFEIDVVGPGGGSNFDVLNASVALDLYYWSSAAQRFEVIPSAYDAGAETGETSDGLASTWTPNGYVGLSGSAGPAVHLGQGPSLLYGEWNVTPSTEGIAPLGVGLSPSNGFVFVGAGTDPSWSSFGWAPPASSYDLPPAVYTVWGLASEYRPLSATVTLPGGGATVPLALTADTAGGVYTPLWAFTSAGLANISSSCSAGACVLDNNAPGPVGAFGPPGASTDFPWFGAFNDFFFPVFPGIFLWNVADVVVASPPAFAVTTPSWLAGEATALGTPTSNDLGLFFYDDSNITLTSAAAIGGWWFDPAYFGANAPQYSAVFWNTSDSSVVSNTFTSGGGALYLYGGENNSIWNNTFLQYTPLAPNPGTVVAAVHGANGIFDADFGDGRSAGPGCHCGDLIYNNQVGDYHTAYAPTVDPYTGLAPRLPFDEVWNVTPRPGLNIVGGDTLGGNYWWDYGTSLDPFWTLPYNASGSIATGGDAHPLVPTPLYTVTFDEVGLPAGVDWHLSVYTSTGLAVNSSTGSSLTELWPTGEYFYTGNSDHDVYGIPSTGVFEVNGANLTVHLNFYPLFTLTFVTTNFPVGSFWAITISNGQFGAFIDLGNVAEFPGTLLASAVYNYTISPPAGYTVAPLSGSVNLTSNRSVPLAFSKSGAPGELLVTLDPTSGAQLWVDGNLVPIPSTGAVNLTLAAGVHSVEATESGYVPYFNNVTIEGGGVTDLAINFTPLAGGSAPGTSSATVPPVWWALVGALAGGVVVLGLALAYTARRGRAPPPSASNGPRTPPVS